MKLQIQDYERLHFQGFPSIFGNAASMLGLGRIDPCLRSLGTITALLGGLEETS